MSDRHAQPEPNDLQEPSSVSPERAHGTSPVLWGAISLIVLILVALVAGGAWMALRDTASPTLPTPAPVAQTVAGESGTPAAAVSPDAPRTGGTPAGDAPTSASPAGTPAPRSGSLPSLLALAPDRLDDDSVPLPIVASYADLVAWTTAQGMTMPAGPDDPELAAWAGTLEALALPTSLATRGMEPIWQECYGFTLPDVHQVLSVGAAPNSVTIMTGTFDRRTLEDAWVRNGYQAVKIEGVTIWSLFPGDTIDLSARASRPSLGSLNNIVLLEDGTLVAAAKLSRLQAVLKVVHGYQTSLAQNNQVQDLIAPLGNGRSVISAEIARGTLVEASPERQPGAPATPDPAGTPLATPGRSGGPSASPEMPEVSLVLIGLRVAAGEPTPMASPAALSPSPVDMLETGTRVEMIAIFTFVDPDAPLATARSIMAQRLTGGRSGVTGEPYTHQYRELRLRGASRAGGGATLVLEAELIDGPAAWRRIVETRDLGFAFWEAGP